MTTKFILQGTAKWSYDYEMAEFTSTQKIMASMTSFVPPLHRHEGNIVLTNSEIIIEGTRNDKENLTIRLSQLKQIYLGFDDLFPATSVKSRGLLWQPLRIEYYINDVETQSIYLIIDFNGMFTHDKDWYKTLTEMLG